MTEEIMNNNAIETVKVLTDEINHYRDRQFKSTVLHATLSGFIVYFIYTATATIQQWTTIIAIFLYSLLSVFFIGVVYISKVRGKYAKAKRSEILKNLSYPNSYIFEYNEASTSILRLLNLGVTLAYILAIITFTTFTNLIILLH